jgi:prolyl oligopeptidase
MHASSWLAAVIVGGAVVALARADGDGRFNYPPAKRGDTVDDYHGTKVPDPYRWLEDDVRKSPEVRAWVEAENSLTNAYLESIPQRSSIRKRITELMDYEKYSAPSKHGGRYFWMKNDGLQNQSVLYTQESLDAPPRVLLDPNKWSEDGTVALSGLAVSEDGKYLAYGVADAGSDWHTWHVLDVATAKPLSDELKWVKFSGAAWTKDGKGFFYGRFDEPGPGAKYQSLNLNQHLVYHRLGTPQSDDVLVYRRPDHPEWTFNASVTEDGRYLVITTHKGTDNNCRVTYKDLSEPYGLPVELIDNFESEYSLIDNDGPVFWFKTDKKAPRGKVIAIDIRKPDPANWKEVIPEAKDNLVGVNMVGNLFVATYLKDARTQVKMFDPRGRFVREVEFPTLGSAGGFGGKRTDTETFYTFTSFITPPVIYRYDLITGQSTLFRKANVKFNPDDYEVRQVFFPSKDGTRVPMFLSMKKGTKLDGNNPTLLYGYGGFNIPLTPGFSVSRLQWMEMGGIFAQANLRGGGEYGQEWHKAGTKLRKQNVFDDFIAAAEWLVKERYTSTAKLAIMGGSNGGLLVGACMTQRPDLYGACLPAVGVMDMLRFQKFTAGRFWVDDYGSSDNAEEFKALHAYSPYHNLKKGTKYPATLVTTADTDDRVVPGHSFKFLAELQYCQAGPAPVMGRIETRAGHGAGKPTAKQIEEVADQWAFLVKNLHMDVTIPDRVAAAPSGNGSAPAEKKDEGRAEKKKESATAPVPRAKEKRWPQMHENFVAQAKRGGAEVLFLGDSITDAWGGEGHDPKAKGTKVLAEEFGPIKVANFGIGGDRTQHVLWRLQNGELGDSFRPKVVMLMIGTNNTRDNTAEEIAGGVKAVVATIHQRSPETKVLLLAVFPRGERPGPVREKLKRVNELIARLDDGGKTVKYLDIGDKFVNADGTISREIMPDFLHLSEKGYRIWADAVKAPLQQLLGR